jgi:hypothetical protein
MDSDYRFNFFRKNCLFMIVLFFVFFHDVAIGIGENTDAFLAFRTNHEVTPATKKISKPSYELMPLTKIIKISTPSPSIILDAAVDVPEDESSKENFHNLSPRLQSFQLVYRVDQIIFDNLMMKVVDTMSYYSQNVMPH